MERRRTAPDNGIIQNLLPLCLDVPSSPSYLVEGNNDRTMIHYLKAYDLS
ncbi:hypothetical protein KP509_37G025100 [Ceratopteris richardii]|nr:hypothetical protein KP509_37G025100 [Ceratopteris richardii]